MSNTITVADIKNALKDEAFRKTLPESLTTDVQKFLQNPNCSCNMKIYQNILQNAEEQVKKYYPQKNYISPQNTMETIMQNSWTVINCNVWNLEEELKKLKHGRKQIAMSRYQDSVTVIVNELEAVY